MKNIIYIVDSWYKRVISSYDAIRNIDTSKQVQSLLLSLRNRKEMLFVDTDSISFIYRKMVSAFLNPHKMDLESYYSILYCNVLLHICIIALINQRQSLMSK